MKKLLKKVLTISLCACMLVGIAFSASASAVTPYGKPENGVHWRNKAKSNGYMNCYVWNASEVVEGVKVTLYQYDDSITQKFYTLNKRVKPSANPNLSVAYQLVGGMPAAMLKPDSYGYNTYDIVPSDGGYKLMLHYNNLMLIAGGNVNSSTPLMFAAAEYQPVDQGIWFI